MVEDFIEEKRVREGKGILLVERRNERKRRKLILMEYFGRLFWKGLRKRGELKRKRKSRRRRVKEERRGWKEEEEKKKRRREEKKKVEKGRVKG